MVCWLVGGESVKGKLSQVNIRQLQTVPNIKIDQYKPLFNQPKPSQASPDASDRALEYPRFSTFLKSVKWLWPPEAQLATSTFDLFDQNCRVIYGSGSLTPNLGSLTWKTNGAFSRCLIVPIIISGQGKRVCWLVGGKCVNRKLSQINFDQH